MLRIRSPFRSLVLPALAPLPVVLGAALVAAAPSSAQADLAAAGASGAVGIDREVLISTFEPKSTTTRMAAAEGGRVFLVTFPSSVRAIDVASGEVLWTNTTPALDGLAVGALTAAADGSAAYVLASASVPAEAGGVQVLRFDGETGACELIATLGEDGPAAIGLGVDLSPDGSRIHAVWSAQSSGGITASAVDLATGALLWSDVDSGLYFGFGSVQALTADLAIAMRTILSVGASVSAYDADTGSVVWSALFDNAVSIGVSHEENLGVAAGTGVIAGGPDSLIGFDPADGARLWSAAEGGVDFAIARDGSRVYLASSDSGLKVRALDGTNGAELWAETLALDVGLPTSLALDEATGRVVVSTVDGVGLANDVEVAAFDAATGAVLWSDRIDAGNSDFLFGSETLAPGLVGVIGALDVEPADVGFARAYASSDGSLAWDVEQDSIGSADDRVVAAAQSVDGASIYALSRSPGDFLDVAAVDVSDGSVRWTAELEAPSGFGSEAVTVSPDGSRLFVRSPRDLDDVLAIFALDEATGEVLWQRELAGYDYQFATWGEDGGDVAPDGSAFYVTWMRDTGADPGAWGVAALDAADGSSLWEVDVDPGDGRDLPRGLRVTPDGARVLVHGQSVLPSGPSPTGSQAFAQVYCLDAATGAELWEDHRAVPVEVNGVVKDGISVAAEVLVDPAGDVAYVIGNADRSGSSGAPAGQIAYALDVATGAEVWSSVPDFTVESSSAALSLDGNRLVTAGATYLANPFIARDAVTLAYDTATGARLWRDERDLGAFEGEAHVAIGEDGNTVLVGSTSTTPFASGNPTSTTSESQAVTTALDLESGAALWQVRYGGPTGMRTGVRAAFADPAGSYLYLVADTPAPVGDRDLALVAYRIPTLVPDAAELSIAAAGTVAFALRPGTGSEAEPYFLLGSATGTSPGVPVGNGLVLPLVPDRYFGATRMAAAPTFSGFQGVLSANGLGAASLTLPASLSPSLAGLELYHAFLVPDGSGGASFVSNLVRIELRP